jgi:hypothetical protein
LAVLERQGQVAAMEYLAMKISERMPTWDERRVS